MKIIIFFWLASVLFLLTGCKKFVDVPPPSTALSNGTVFSSNATAAAAVSGLYVSMYSNSVGGGRDGISALLGASADEFSLYPSSVDLVVNEAYANALQSTNSPTIWADLYNVINQSNAAIAGISASQGVTAPMKAQLVGECEVVRAFCYFYLVNIYGDVPLLMTSNYQANQGVGRTAASTVYKQIIIDLKDAQTKLGTGYFTASGASTTERVRPNAGVATALLSRVYLFTDSMQNAEAEATKVISNAAYYLDPNLNNVFLSTSTEAIWQVEVPDEGLNTADGATFLLQNFGGPSGDYPYFLADSITNGFEAGDLRRVNWVDSIVAPPTTYYFPYKYKLYYTGMPPTEYPVLLRLGEQFLIRAEAEANLGDLVAAANDLNKIRARAGLNPTSATSQTGLLAAIMRERRFELFTEYGHRWLDLKRSGQVDSVMTQVTPQKGGSWSTNAQWLPIPFLDTQEDPNLKQNKGYQ